MKILVYCLVSLTCLAAQAAQDIAVPIRMAHATGSIVIENSEICKIDLSVPVYPLRDPKGPILFEAPAYLDCVGEIGGKKYSLRSNFRMEIRNFNGVTRKWLDAITFVMAGDFKDDSLGILNGGTGTQTLNERYMSIYHDRVMDKHLFAITVHIDDFE